MKKALTKQELHQLAMNIVGEDLEAKSFEFLGINSDLKSNPQFVALKDKKLHFVLVRAVAYPEHPKKFDVVLVKKVKNHAEKFNARVFYAGVGLANSKNYELPINNGDEYVINYDGLQEV